ncbi:MAG TPA: VanZ family protein [Gemmatimonadaceae bacterium]|nr:VanZ family protein [Gemmatimonadaceae bacterium]
MRHPPHPRLPRRHLILSGVAKPWLVAALIWTVLVLTANSLSVRDPRRAPFPGADKVTHAGMYGAAAYAWRRAFRAPSDRITWLVASGMTALGAADEWHQQWVPGRSPEVLDWLADASGVVVALLAWRSLHTRERLS